MPSSRYPSQRHPVSGQPIALGETVWTPLNNGVAQEWEEVIDGVLPRYKGQPEGQEDSRMKVFTCPTLDVPRVTVNQPKGNDPYVFHMKYFYLGGASSWTLSDPAFSPIRPTDPPDWTLMADMITENPHPKGEFTKEWTAHPTRGGTPTGSNHLFHDGHVDWVRWNNGNGMRANAYWSPGEYFYWRRTLGAP